MTSPRPLALQICPFSQYLESALNARFEIVRWWELDGAAQRAWLASHAGRVRAVATGAQFGCPNELMAALPALGIVSVNGVGIDKVDLEFARARGVRVGNTPGAPTLDTADLAVGLVIGLLRGLPSADAYVRAGRWPKGDVPLTRRVTGCTFGIVGLGSIGSAVAARLAPFGPIAYTGPNRKPVDYAYEPDLLSLARQADVLVVTCPANAATRHMIGASVFAALGPTSYLVNVARGSVVDEAALCAALEAGTIAGAALDVYQNEPHVPESLRRSPKTVLTPHMASGTVEGRKHMADMMLANLDAFFADEPLPTAVV
ncbi:MAG TPA: 2-hydroxyacid dehydrogenase [Gammaproteobacteria bacterium]|nr:2-hydroxyacid dehydrogenase [Gammaproteobacteria bacterium]